jgi:hypothetical protein
MENKGSLSPKSCDLIQALLKEPKIYDRVTAPIKGRERYKKVQIIRESGLIQFGKYSWSSSIGAFWNNLIKCKKDVSFEEFALRVWDALVDMTAGTAAAEPVLEGLGRETLMEGIRSKRWDWLVDRFYDICRHLAVDSYWKTQGTPEPQISEGRNRRKTGNDSVVITVAEHQPRVFKVVDAVGDAFEILNVRWVGGK